MKNKSLKFRLAFLVSLILFFSSSILAGGSIASINLSEGTPNSVENPANNDDLQQDGNAVFIILINFAIVVIVGTVSTYFVVGKTLHPLAELSNAIEKTDENNLFMKVHEPTSNDEVAKLSVSFNNMVGKLEKAFVAQKNFSANAAHELKTPLTAMIANVECCLLDEFPSPLECRETLEDVLQSTERLNTLVSDLLKMNMDETMILREKIDAKKMFDEIIAELSDEQSGHIRIDNHVGDITLYGDKCLLNRAFSNLIHNAVKYNKPGGAVEISAAQIDDTLVISILDTGIGISSDQIDKIFSPFYCVDKSRSRELGGSGLGLSIVKSIVDKHGGRVQVQSTLGVSTTVTVTLPK